MSDELKKTIFLDIDGCIFKHHGSGMTGQLTSVELLPGVIERFKLWDEKGYKIILTTGRRESSRKTTEEQLQHFGLFWDTLVMGLPRGQRLVINDMKPGGDFTAVSINLIRNKGLGSIDI